MLSPKKIFGLLIILLHLKTEAQQFNICDGPYISYNRESVIVRSVNSSSKVISDTFPVSEIGNHSFPVQFSNHHNWDFNFRIKKQIRTEPSEYGHVDRILAISDIEGEFEALRELLLANRVMDTAYRWTFGKNHLVVCGDLFDRGRDVTAVIWLLYKLEDDAISNGGFVHVLLGNHDIMNLSGDFRYLDQKYIAYARFMGVRNMDLYNRDSELGRWLLSKNLIENIDGNLCMHAGMSPDILGNRMSLNDINTSSRPYYSVGTKSERIKTMRMKEIFGDEGLFWYRGYFTKPRASDYTVENTLSFYSSTRIVVGHTIAESNISSYYDGKVIGIDVDEHAGKNEGILILKNKVYTIDGTGKMKPVEEGPDNPIIL